MHKRDVESKGRKAADEESAFLRCHIVHILMLFSDVYIVNVWRLTKPDLVMQEYASRVAYCIPILANAAMCNDVSIQQTPEMQKEAIG